MYLNYVVDIPEIKGKITFRSKGNAAMFIMNVIGFTILRNNIQPSKGKRKINTRIDRWFLLLHN